MSSLRLFVSFPEELVSRPIVYELIKEFDVVPNIRRANVEAHSGWIILELDGADDARDQAIAYLEGLGKELARTFGDQPWMHAPTRLRTYPLDDRDLALT